MKTVSLLLYFAQGFGKKLMVNLEKTKIILYNFFVQLKTLIKFFRYLYS